MPAFFSKLHAPRADFPLTMTAAERELMQAHALYLRDFTAKGWLVAFGPVADPQGYFGIAVWQVPEGTDVAALLADDPVRKSGLGFRYEIHPMPSLITRTWTPGG